MVHCFNAEYSFENFPDLPPDFSVNWNQTTAKPNRVNTTLNYTCARKCKNIFLPLSQIFLLYLCLPHRWPN